MKVSFSLKRTIALFSTGCSIFYHTIVLYSRDDEGVGVAHGKISPKSALISPHNDMTVIILVE